eukprot:TRINITY_DN95548_c0_g1_i1.p1 TRINITY_DN95548_c0_g1~~TRINITY_DN95548_c0_g1_i1.p1  ORF type:complete len:377 (+),score=49.66 TRINITY_DN95548_c0_g1_i1:44-1174(+)
MKLIQMWALLLSAISLSCYAPAQGIKVVQLGESQSEDCPCLEDAHTGKTYIQALRDHKAKQVCCVNEFLKEHPRIGQCLERKCDELETEYQAQLASTERTAGKVVFWSYDMLGSLLARHFFNMTTLEISGSYPSQMETLMTILPKDDKGWAPPWAATPVFHIWGVLSAKHAVASACSWNRKEAFEIDYMVPIRENDGTPQPGFLKGNIISTNWIGHIGDEERTFRKVELPTVRKTLKLIVDGRRDEVCGQKSKDASEPKNVKLNDSKCVIRVQPFFAKEVAEKWCKEQTQTKCQEELAQKYQELLVGKGEKALNNWDEIKRTLSDESGGCGVVLVDVKASNVKGITQETTKRIYTSKASLLATTELVGPSLLDMVM